MSKTLEDVNEAVKYLRECGYNRDQQLNFFKVADLMAEWKVKNCHIANVVGQSEQLCPNCKVELKPLYNEMACFKCMHHFPRA